MFVMEKHIFEQQEVEADGLRQVEGSTRLPVFFIHSFIHFFFFSSWVKGLSLMNKTEGNERQDLLGLPACWNECCRCQCVLLDYTSNALQTTFSYFSSAVLTLYICCSEYVFEIFGDVNVRHLLSCQYFLLLLLLLTNLKRATPRKKKKKALTDTSQ